MAQDPAAGGPVLTGESAYGSWEQDKPGRKLLIRPSDMPRPMPSESSSNSPGLVGRPRGAMPEVMPGFRVTRFAGGLEQPRVITVAPNGDVFVSDSAAGKVHVYRMGRDGSVERQSIFASGLDQPFGIAFYPPGPDPQGNRMSLR